jgi:hypothetical protein
VDDDQFGGLYRLLERFVESQERIAELFEQSLESSARIAAAQEEHNRIEADHQAARAAGDERVAQWRAEDLERIARERAEDREFAVQRETRGLDRMFDSLRPRRDSPTTGVDADPGGV